MDELYTIYKGDLSLYPCPTVLVTSKNNTIDNVCTVSWAGIASSHPEYVTIAINKKRFSYDIIRASKRFCINIPDASQIEKVDFCGSYSGRDIDKFKSCNFTKVYYESEYVLINECPLHLLCEIENEIELGSHTLFVARIANKLLGKEIDSNNIPINPIVYCRPNYYKLNPNPIGYYGYIMGNDTFPTERA